MARTSDFFQTLTIQGGASYNGMEPAENLQSATLDLSVDQDSEIEFVMDDPKWVYFNSFGKDGPISKDATYEDLALRVSSYTLDGGPSGNGGTTLRMRPRAIEKSRAIRGALHRENLTPSQFVIDAARSAGANAITQDSPVRQQINRDSIAKEEEDDSEKNEWTTLKRLAAEEGFLLFERANTFVFGSPQWLFDTSPTHIFSWGPGAPFKQNWMLELPSAEISTTRRIQDTISFKVPTDSTGIILPGQCAEFVGLPPFFAKKLLITNVTYPLVGIGDMEITARSPWVIEKQKTPEQVAAEQAAAAAARNQGSGGGSGGGGTNIGPGGSGSDFYAREIIAAAKERNLGPDGARNGIATALVESGLRMYANNAVPESLKFPHDAVGSDHDSVGLFQQRQAGWGTLAERMNARASAGLFFNKMMSFNWRSMDPGAACQKVQVSAYPGKYAQRMGEAAGYVQRLGY